MTETDDILRERLQAANAAAESGRAPAFSDTWAAAEARATAGRRRSRLLAVSAVIAALSVLIVSQVPDQDEGWHYVDSAELLGSTSWSAPSDSLMPVRRFDIYQDMPVLIESTGSDGGALL